MKNSINLLKEDLKNHKVTVKLPGEEVERTLFLIMIKAMTNSLKEFRQIYDTGIVPLHIKLAEKIFSNTETESVYGVLIDEDLRMVFAFNREFADYDKKSQSIKYKDPDGFLIGKLEVKDKKKKKSLSKTKMPDFELPFNKGRGGGSGVMRYSLAEAKTCKKKKDSR